MRAIKGAIKQTWDNKEIIVIDDNSTDNSYKLISFRQHSGIMVWNTELDIDRSLFKLQDENNLYLLGQKYDDNNDAADWLGEDEIILISLNKNNG